MSPAIPEQSLETKNERAMISSYMKKSLLGIGALFSLLIGGWYFTRQSVANQAPLEPSQNVLGVATPIPGGDVQSTPAFSGEQITLIPNFTNPNTSEDIKKQNSCEYLINGGFYTKEGQPVGLFQSNGKTLRGSHESALFNAFLTINEMDTPRITETLPKDSLKVALQVGPLLVANAKVQHLSIRNDEEARRIVALVTGENKIMFLAVQNTYLEMLPERVFSWAKAEGVNIADAVNLDGGSASAFRTPDYSFPEITPIGSAFCVKSTEE